MAETVLITTHDLHTAVPLRDAFRANGFGTELLTAGERIGDVPDPVLLVLTGAVDEKRSRRLVREAAGLDHLPVVGLVESVAQAEPAARRALGLDEAFTKPVEPAEVVLGARRLIERRRLRAITGILGETEAMREAIERILLIAPVHSTVLITGESGTGKELVARGLHALSPRRDRPFIATNVAALPETLLESELFGHEKGAFTGAIAQRRGFFELAHQGTLFLDEIGEMPPATQTKLLRVLEEREFMRVGGEAPLQVDVRVIAATNQELRTLVEIGDFRRDLYYRLNVLHVHLPPLRERRADIPLLVDAFLRDSGNVVGRPPLALSPDAMRILLDYQWPGNVRELRNVIESLVVLVPGDVVRPEDLPATLRSGRASALLPVPLPARNRDGREHAPELEFIFRTLLQLRIDIEDLRREFEEYRRAHPEIGAAPLFPYVVRPGLPAPAIIEEAEVRDGDVAGVALQPDTRPRFGPDDFEEEEDEGVVVYRAGMTMQDLEREAITAALQQVKGNRRKAAEVLGIGERTLYRKIKEYGIPL